MKRGISNEFFEMRITFYFVANVRVRGAGSLTFKKQNEVFPA